MQRIGGLRRKSRQKLGKHFKESGKTPIRRHMQTFKEGDKVLLKADSSRQSGMYNLRFHGFIAEVTGKQGACYQVQVKDGGKQKTLLVHPVHLRRAK